MGLMFTPLSMTALSNVPKHKIGQASGLFNVIRQLGGSFGIAFMSTMLPAAVQFIIRQHSARS